MEGNPSGIKLGVPGALIPSPDSHSGVSKVGGRAWFPAAKLPTGTEDLGCPACQSCLALLLQIHAPSEHGCLRTIYLFACPNYQCKAGQGSFRAVSYKPQDNVAADRQQPEEPAPRTQITEHAQKVRQDTWDTSAEWGPSGAWGDEPADDASADPFNMSDLQEQLTGMTSSSADHEPTRHSRALAPPPVQEQPSSSAPCAPLLQAPIHFPHFYLCFEGEPQQASHKDSNYIQKLMGCYQEAETQEGTSKTAKPDESPSETWTAEQYEPDATPSASASYLKFMKRLRRQPQQCVRYGLQGQLLWPESLLPPAPECLTCSKPKAFEMQAMPPLMYALSEAQEMTGEAAATDEHSSVPDCWDWLTIAIFSCPVCSFRADDGNLVELSVLVVQDTQ